MPRVTITVPEKNAQPYRFKLGREVVTLGRGSENDIAIDCGSISVRHAEMRRVQGGYELIDLGSTNGMKFGGERREKVKLLDGITVQLGDVAFDFSLSEEEMETLRAEKPERDRDEPMTAEDLPPLEEEEVVIVAEDDSSGGGGLAGLVVVALVLSLVALVAGMAVRFQQDTGGDLFDAIKNKGAESVAPVESGADE